MDKCSSLPVKLSAENVAYYATSEKGTWRDGAVAQWRDGAMVASMAIAAERALLKESSRNRVTTTDQARHTS